MLVVDDAHLDFRQTPRLRKMLQELSRSGREQDTWTLVTTGSPGTRVDTAPGSAAIRAAVSRLTGNALTVREQLDAFGDPDRGAIVRRRALLTDIAISQAISQAASESRPLSIVFFTGGYDSRMIPEMSEVVRATGAARARLVVVSVPDLVPERDVPPDVRPDEWAPYVEALRASLRNLAEQTGGTAVFSRDELDGAFARLSKP